MNRRGILFIGMMLLVVSIIAQPNNRQQKMEQMKQYVENNIVPFMQIQRAKLISSFNKDEMAKLDDIQNDFKNFQNQGKQIRESMRGHYNAQMAKIRKDALDSILNRANNLLVNHKAETLAYKKAVMAEKEKWEKDMNAMQLNFMQRSNCPQCKHPLMDKIDNPAFLLVWNNKNIPWDRMNRMNGNRMGNRGKAYGRKMTKPFMKDISPQIKEKLFDYAKKNIAPVVLAEQKAFNVQLSNKELKRIAIARKEILSHKEMFLNMHNNNFQEQIPPFNDSIRLSMRLEMQKAIMPVQKIALDHYSEIEKHLEKIKKNFPQWRKDLQEIIYGSDNRPMHRRVPMMFKNKIRRLNRPVAFLLFDNSFFEQKRLTK